jgi:hypothetical protein
VYATEEALWRSLKKERKTSVEGAGEGEEGKPWYKGSGTLLFCVA